MAKTKLELERDIHNYFAAHERKRNKSAKASRLTMEVADRVAPFTRYDPLPVSKVPARVRTPGNPSGRTEAERKLHPEMFACKDRRGKILGTSDTVRGAMAKAPEDKSYAIVRGEFTSDKFNHGVGGGRTVAVRDNGRWLVG